MATSAAARSAFRPPICASIRPAGSSTASMRSGSGWPERPGAERHDGVASFGRRPMFDTGGVLLEVFLFDFQGDLYGRTLDVAFIHWIRPELLFDTTEGPGPAHGRGQPPWRAPHWRGRRASYSRRSAASDS